MENKLKLLDYLKSHDLMFLSTVSSEPAICTVYYGIDDDFQIYMVTSPSTEHGKNILENHKVACVIINSNQPLFETQYKVGAQLKGTSEQITDIKHMKKALEVWSKFNERMVNTYMNNITKNSVKSRPFIIKPKEIKWFNEELYGKEGTETFLF